MVRATEARRREEESEGWSEGFGFSSKMRRDSPSRWYVGSSSTDETKWEDELKSSEGMENE